MSFSIKQIPANQLKIMPVGEKKPVRPKYSGHFTFSPRDPYRIFFPLGFIHLIFGLIPWILAAVYKDSFPSHFHTYYAGIGYFSSLIVGFLLTAVPRLIGTSFISRNVWTTLVLFNLLALFGGLISLDYYRYFIALFLLTATIVVGKRLFSKPINNPAFLFLPLGLLFGVAGIIFYELPIGKILFIQNFLLLITMGTGAYLMTILMGINPRNPFLKEHFMLLLALIVAATLFDLFSSTLGIGAIIRAVAALIFGYLQLNIHQFVKRDARQAKGLWFTFWNIVLGFVAYAIWPNAHTLHWLIISGFFMLTYFMSLRVVFAHGGYDIEIEKSGKSLYWILALILIAAATRLSAPYMSTYLNHLAYASFNLLVVLLIWLLTITKQLLSAGPKGEH